MQTQTDQEDDGSVDLQIVERLRRLRERDHRIQFQDVVPIQMLAGCTSGISSALIGCL